MNCSVNFLEKRRFDLQYALLGKTGLMVSRVGFGGIPIQQLEQEAANEIIDKALEMGINFIDSAKGYNKSEKLIGNALVGKREKVYLASKSMSRDKEAMLKDVEGTLQSFRTDYIDLYQLHNISSMEELERVMKPDGALTALKELKEKGIVKHIGITSHKLDIIEKALDIDDFETVQYPYSVVEQQAREVFAKAHEIGVGTIAMKPLAGGSLDDARTAIKYILEDYHLDCAIPGMESIEQIMENVQAADGVKLSEEEKEQLVKKASELGQTFCRRCGYCLPCPQKINIPQVFLMEGYYSRYDLVDWALERYNGMEVKADACKKCGICEKRCPYELPIREMLERAKNILQ